MHAVFYQAQAMFYHLCLNYFEIYTAEESSQPTKRANKILVSIFLTVKATILDTHRINYLLEKTF